ncbi:MAG: hypothetical protein EP330_31340 [Deltaproteobacteria bacterium]|nr:MAG: hypothetical protein EP330_31340 [Deltaproteobacteria bacterium]
MRVIPVLALLACGGGADTAPESTERPWSGGLEDLDGVSEVRGYRRARTIVHLHSPWSHDACDGDPLPDGEPNAPCLADLRAGLCAARIDAAFLTDHPTHAAYQPYADLFHPQSGDTLLPDAQAPFASGIDCDDGHRVHWFPGIEDELMPVGLDAHVPGTAEERDASYNDATTAGLTASSDAGAAVLVAHTEGRDLAWLEELQDAGLVGIEIFNLHAMFAPDIRQDDLGLEALGWVNDTRPFIHPDETGEPDLLFLGVLLEQAPSIERWEALLQRGPTVGVAGTDAHQNAVPLETRDGERFDSYRRSLRWFSNHLLVEGQGPGVYEEALRAGRNHVVFEALGLPLGVDLALTDDSGTTWEVGSSPTGEGTLLVGCPSLSPESPQGLRAPEITVSVLKDGEVFHEGCGEVSTDGPGAYRVKVEVTPYHLEPFLGAEPETYFRPFPWVYTNAIRVGL